MKTHSGFGVIGVMLVILVLGILGFAGWKVYDMKHPLPPIDTDYTKSKTDTKTANADLPAGFVAYTHKDLGVTFAYPKAWGAASTGPSPESPHFIKGTEYMISFSENPNVTAGVSSPDVKHDPNMGHDGAFYAGQYVKMTNATREKSLGPNNTVHFSDQDSVIVSAGLGGIGCVGAGSVLVRQLPDNEKFPAIAFLYMDQRTEDINSSFDKELNAWSNGDPNAICEGDGYKRYISTDHVEELKKVNSTIAVEG